MRSSPFFKEVVCFCSILSAAFFSCDESLPPYEAPQNVLQAQLSLFEEASPRRVICPSLGWTLPALIFKISVTNNYSETLQGPAGVVSGEIEIWRKENPDFGRKLTFRGATDSRHVKNGILTLDPGETLEVLAEWYHVDEQNRRIWQVFNDPFNPRPFTAKIRARARIKVFFETPLLFPAETETEVYYDVNPNIPSCNQ